MFWHSGVPFSVLSTSYSANGNGIVEGSGPQFAKDVMPSVDPLDCKRCNIYRVSPKRARFQWLNPNAFVSTVDPSTGALLMAEIARKRVNSETLAATNSVGRTFSGATSISRSGFP